MHNFLKILKWTVMVFIVLFVVAEFIRWPFRVREEKTAELVAKIHNTKLTLDDVMGKNLPPDPGAEADKTIAGIDANTNGIRDDVELAIFEAYPNSAKTRAVLLQYALALQMEFTQPIVNTITVTEVIREEDRAYACIGKILVVDVNNKQSRDKYFEDGDKLDAFVKQKQINTIERDKAQADFYKYLRSYNSLPRTCDIDYSTLPN
jgi:hypothetical protein